MKYQNKIKNLKRIAKLLDSQFEGPGNTRYGIDGLLGLVPGVGDLITSCASVYLIIASARLGCGPAILLRMSFNIALENIFDMIPILGNVFDFYWKSNLKNIDLLEKHLANPKKEAVFSNFLIVSILIFLCLFIISTLYFSFLILKNIYIFLIT